MKKELKKQIEKDLLELENIVDVTFTREKGKTYINCSIDLSKNFLYINDVLEGVDLVDEYYNGYYGKVIQCFYLNGRRYIYCGWSHFNTTIYSIDLCLDESN